MRELLVLGLGSHRLRKKLQMTAAASLPFPGETLLDISKFLDIKSYHRYSNF